MPQPTEEGQRVFDNLSDLHKENLKLYGLGFPDDGAPDISRFTCADCPVVSECKLAYDAYNTDGDCLAMK